MERNNNPEPSITKEMAVAAMKKHENMSPRERKEMVERIKNTSKTHRYTRGYRAEITYAMLNTPMSNP